MQFNFNTYIPGDSIIHRADARVKLVLLLAYSITLFLVNTWTGLLFCIAMGAFVCLLSRVPIGRLLKLLIPLYVILIFTLLFNSFVLDVSQGSQAYGLGDISSGIFANMQPVALMDDFGFVPAGFARGCFYALRIVFLVLASLVVSFTTTSTELIDALNDFMRPLRFVRVPTEDIAMIISVAIRFIPVTAEELFRIKAAQQSRGAVFDEGGLVLRIKAWLPVMIPLFVGLFRRANDLALAMEARCYGMSHERTRLRPRAFSLSSAAILMLGIAVCVACGVLF